MSATSASAALPDDPAVTGGKLRAGLDLAQTLFELALPAAAGADAAADASARGAMLESARAVVFAGDGKAALYSALCADTAPGVRAGPSRGWVLDEAALARMTCVATALLCGARKLMPRITRDCMHLRHTFRAPCRTSPPPPPSFNRAANAAAVTKLEEAVASAAASFGDVEVQDAKLALARYLGEAGDVPRAMAAYAAISAPGSHVSTGQLVDIAMAKARLALQAADWALAKTFIAEAKACVGGGGRWAAWRVSLEVPLTPTPHPSSLLSLPPSLPPSLPLASLAQPQRQGRRLGPAQPAQGV